MHYLLGVWLTAQLFVYNFLGLTIECWNVWCLVITNVLHSINTTLLNVCSLWVISQWKKSPRKCCYPIGHLLHHKTPQSDYFYVAIIENRNQYTEKSFLVTYVQCKMQCFWLNTHRSICSVPLFSLVYVASGHYVSLINVNDKESYKICQDSSQCSEFVHAPVITHQPRKMVKSTMELCRKIVDIKV